VEDGRVVWVEGNPHLLQGALCGKGAAGPNMIYREERPQGPMIRQGKRGGGQWKRVGWDEALDYTAQRMSGILDKYGGRSVLLSCRGGPFQDLPKTFLRALRSPNFTNHDAACGINVHHASQSVYGVERKGFVYDIANTRHLILLGRNLLESLQVGEARSVMAARKRGMSLTCIDVRATVTASKATRFWMVRPGTDYALLLAIVREVIAQGAYDAAFVQKHCTGFDDLVQATEPCTTDWAEHETGVPAGAIRDFVAEISEQRPAVIFHPGWMTARYRNSFYVSRTLHVLNALMGNVEVEGGQILAKGMKDAGQAPLRSLADQVPAPTERRADGVGWKYKHFDKGPGLFHLFQPAIMEGDPYPLKCYLFYRHDPLVCFPDREAQLTMLDRLDLLVSIDAKFGETTWYADVILPNSAYLEKDSPIAVKQGPKPMLIRRRKVVEPVHDSKPEWWIFRELAARLGCRDAFPYETVEDLWRFQLDGTGIRVEDFEEKGFVSFVDKPILQDREALTFRTPSGKIEFRSRKLEDACLDSLPAYRVPDAPPDSSFRLVFGRHAIHTHAHTQNNEYLHEVMSQNPLWIHARRAEELGIWTGDEVVVSCLDGSVEFKTEALVTDAIHPEAVFTWHGFGRTVPILKRAYARGMADQRLCKGKLTDFDPVGGGIANQETFVRVRKLAS
jgi:thiosulfate reductase/polysulfide reductase chain A